MSGVIRYLVFDLDGTIYQDLDFYKDYIHFLTRGTDKEAWRDSLICFTQDVLSGKRLRMNSFYCNEPIPAEDPARYFPLLEAAAAPSISCSDMPSKKEYTYLGDAWSVVALYGCTLGLFEGERAEEIYRLTRRRMERAGRTGNARLGEAIQNAGKKCETILLSNSYRDTGLEFLRQLGFNNIFNKCAFSVEKPYGMMDALKTLCPAALDAPETVLTIGDHAFNDLAPLARIGCRTLWMNPYPGIREPCYDVCLRTPDELADYLNALISEENSVDIKTSQT